jgi:hypothetical protein
MLSFRFPQHPFLKPAAVFLLCCGSVWQGNSQDLITTMTEQVAKLELCLSEAKKGYGILQTGLTTINQIKKGDFDLHSLFFGALQKVNPAIRSYGKIADMIAMQVQIISGCKQTLQQAVTGSMFGPGDLAYLSRVFTNLSALTVQDIDELTGIITDGDWSMSDDERLARIDQLYAKVTDKYDFLRSFSSHVQADAAIRLNQRNSLQFLSNLTQP